jgi:phosphoribosyl 1,2-cyclic phosphodiesterase
MCVSLTVWSLASGSSGNCIWVEAGETAVLVDAGLSASLIEERLLTLGRSPGILRAVLLTHEHGDHSMGAVPVARRFNVPIVSNAATLTTVLSRSAKAEALAYPTGSAFEVEGVEITSFRVEHDAADPVGYTVACNGTRLCTVTDTGRITPAIRMAMAGCQLVVLESNHDVHRLVKGPYPGFLKTRILSDLGHLSNDAAAVVVASLSEDDMPVCVWLAHLSEVNNTPRLALRCSKDALRFARPQNVRLDVALRNRASLHWCSAENWWQARLF